MKKQWKEPGLEVLDVKMTMQSFNGTAWDNYNPDDHFADDHAPC